jgi:AcrR family transcriptional regulator
VSEVKDGQGRRHYRSAVREESARRTRRAIMLAASELFAVRGYGGASLGEVAAAAGVARPTVIAAFGSKPVLLREVLDEALAGDDDPIPVADRPWFRPVWEARTHNAVLAAYAQVCTLIGHRAARLFEVVRRASDTSPEVAELWDSALRNRRAGASMVIDQLCELGPVDGWPGRDRVVDVLWFFNDPAHYDTLVVQCHWPEHDFTAWLATQMQFAILGNRP